MFQKCRADYFHNTVSCILGNRKVYHILRLPKCFVQVGVTSTNGDLKGFIDQNQSPTKGKRILFVYIEKKCTLRLTSLLCLLN